MKNRKLFVVAFLSSVFLFALLNITIFAKTSGDASGDDKIDLADSVLVLQVLAGIGPISDLHKEADINGDNTLGLEEVIYILQVVSEFRQSNTYPIPSFTLSTSSGDSPLYLSFNASASYDPDGQIIGYSWVFGDGVSDTGMIPDHTYADPGTYKCILTVMDNMGATDSFSAWVVVTGQTEPPEDPADVAPEVDPTVGTTLSEATSFLYTGSNCTQTGIDPDTIEKKRVAILRGKVLDRNGAPLPGVMITILNHPEYGQTLSREDGMFDLAVNGGGYLTLNYSKDGYLKTQRKIEVPWQNYVWLPNVVLRQLDTVSTKIDLSVPGIQIAQSSVVTDGDGTRQATLLISDGTSAEIVMPDGSTQVIDNITIRATEYTVGDNGPEAMPAELPSTSGYTYCVELTADEAIEAGATDVRFTKTLYSYVENFLGFPVGSAVPAGYYDKQLGQWVASDNGRVIDVLSITNERANLDTDGDGTADNTTVLAVLGITDSERQKLALLYPETPQSLWRVPITHFTPWDYNWPVIGPSDAVNPRIPWFNEDGEDKNCKKKGSSIIEIQNQVLGESLPIVGTPFTLNYRSKRVPGFENAYTLDIPVTGDTIPESLKRIDVEILVAGRNYQIKFEEPSSNLLYSFTWDGMDAYNRVLQGAHPVTIRVGYVYDAVYAEPGEFDQAFGAFGTSEIEGVKARDEVIIWQEISDTVGVLDAGIHGLGSWTLNVHHTYDFYAQVLHLGSGERRSADNLTTVLTAVAGSLGNYGDSGDGGPAMDAMLKKTSGVAVGPDGSIYIVDGDSHRIRRVDPDGIITTVAGNGTEGYGGDGGTAVEAQLNNPNRIVLGPDGSLYISDFKNNRIRQVGTDGIITTIAGNGSFGYAGDGGLATEAKLFGPMGIALGPDGTIYISDTYSYRIRRVGTDGIITTAFGNGDPVYSGDGGPAINAGIGFVYDIAVGPDGSLYIADYGNHRIRRVGPDGIITTVAGTGTMGYGGDGGYATAAYLNSPVNVTIAQDGSLYISDLLNFCIRQVTPDGIIRTFAPLGSAVDITFGPEGTLYIAGGTVIREMSTVLPGITLGDMSIASEDGTELYHFDASGRHMRTFDTLLGTVIYAFNYDSNGLLSAIEDRYGNRTTISRNTNGDPMSIIGPYGQSTSLSLDVNGHLSSITNPAGKTHTLEHTSKGLLTKFTVPGDNDYSYTYDDSGLLLRADDPAGGFKVLERTTTDTGHEVTLTTAMNQIDTYSIEYLPTGEKRRVNSMGCCGQNEYLSGTEDNYTITFAGGTVLSAEQGPDPRWA